MAAVRQIYQDHLLSGAASVPAGIHGKLGNVFHCDNGECRTGSGGKEKKLAVGQLINYYLTKVRKYAYNIVKVVKENESERTEKTEKADPEGVGSNEWCKFPLLAGL